jgi:hypothetical protein
MAISAIQPEQQNVVINPSLNTVFFEDRAIAYNYRTGQWTSLDRISSRGFFAVQDSDKQIGTIESSGNFKHIGDGSGGTFSTATVTTGEFDLNPGGRAIVNAIRPIADGATVTSIQVDTRDHLNETIDSARRATAGAKSTGTAVNSRTGWSHFRGATNPAEGRYHRATLVFTTTFTTINGMEVDFTPTGKV